MTKTFEERQLDRANHKLAGRCEHCGVEEGVEHTELCVVSLLAQITELKHLVKKLKNQNQKTPAYPDYIWTDTTSAPAARYWLTTTADTN
jgi:hypothetical protein